MFGGISYRHAALHGWSMRSALNQADHQSSSLRLCPGDRQSVFEQGITDKVGDTVSVLKKALDTAVANMC